MTKLFSCFLGVALLAGTALAQEKKETEAGKKKEAPPVAKESKDTKEVAVIKTSAGEMVVEFWSDVAPRTVENFKKLAKQGFYDGTAFHRIIKGFMIQGGDPKTKDASKEDEYGTGDPGYKIDAEFSDRKHTKGVLSMARNGDPRERFGAMPAPQFANSAGSQFFIVHGDAPHLDNRYTAFGKVIKGLEVLDAIADTPVMRKGGESSKPTRRIEIESVKIVPADSIK
jgi:peptidyl-prolyl cis-trans isomerase B (cyclophilin B)